MLTWIVLELELSADHSAASLAGRVAMAGMHTPARTVWQEPRAVLTAVAVAAWARAAGVAQQLSARSGAARRRSRGF